MFVKPMGVLDNLFSKILFPTLFSETGTEITHFLNLPAVINVESNWSWANLMKFFINAF